MAQIVKLKRTAVSGKIPTTSNLELGELAMNTFDGRIFFEKNSGTAVVNEILTTNTENYITGSLMLNGSITASGIMSIGDISVTGNISGSSFNGTGLVSGSVLRTLDGTGVVSESAQLEGFVSKSANFTTNEIIISDGTNSVVSTDLLTIDPDNNRVGVGTSSPSTKFHIAGDGTNEGQIRLQQANNGSDGPDIAFYSSRGTIASPSAVQGGDTHGRINAYPYNGTSFIQAGSFGWSGTDGTGNNTFDIRSRVSGTLAKRIEITSAGKVKFNDSYEFPTSDGSANEILQTDGSGVLSFSDSPTFTNLVLTGNLTVQGITTTTNTNQLNVGDNIIELNYGGSATEGGIYVKDSTGASTTSGSLIWDSTNDYWKLGTSGSESEVITTSNIVTNLPSGVISGSTQLPSGIVSQSAQTVAHLLNQDIDLGTGDISASIIHATGTGNSLLVDDTLRIAEDGSGLRMTNVGAFESASEGFHIFSNGNLRLSTNGSGAGTTAVIFDQITKDATFEGNILAGNISGSSFNGTGLVSGSVLRTLDGTGVVSESAQLNGFVSKSANFTANELIVADGTNSVVSSNILSLDTTNNYLGINQSNPEVTLHMTGEGAQTAQIRMEQHNDSSDAPDIRTRKSRGTSSSPTKNNAGDFIFRQNSERYNGTGYVTVGQLAVDTNSTNADRFQLSLAVSEDGSSVDAADAQFVIDGNDGGAITFNDAYKFPTSDGTNGQALITNGSGVLSFGDITADVTETTTVSDTFTNQSSITVTHNFGTKNVLVSVYRNDDIQIIPESISLTDTNTVQVELSYSTSGFIVVAKGGHLVSGSISYSDIANNPFSQTGNFITASGHIVPSLHETYDLGSTTRRWRDLYLSGSTIDLGGTLITRDGGTGDINFKDSSTEELKTVVVKELQIGTGANARKVKVDDGKIKFADKDDVETVDDLTLPSGVVSGSAQITNLTTYKESVSGASSYQIDHSLSEQYPIVQAWNTSTSTQEIPQSITTNSANRVTVAFHSTFAGVIIVKK